MNHRRVPLVIVPSEIRVTGAEIKDFYHNWTGWNRWGDGAVYLDEAPFEEEGECLFWHGTEVLPHRVYTVDYGVLGWQGEGPAPHDLITDLVAAMHDHRGGVTYTFITIQVPSGDKAAITAQLAALGLTIVPEGT